MKYMKYLTVLVLLLTVASRSWAQSDLPTLSSGVQLYSHTLDSTLANNSVISSSDIGGANSQSLSCHTAAGDSLFIPTESKWIDINGDNIEKKRRSEANNDVFYTQLRVKRRDLNRGGVEFTSEHEGVYTCHINDENGDRQTMYIGIYTPENIANTEGPVVNSPVFSLLTNLTTHPPQFTITCPSSLYPPLTTIWSRDDTQLIIDGDTPFNAWQVLVNASTSRYDNILCVNGDLLGVYKCVVGDEEHNTVQSLTVQAPSGPPLNVQAVTGGQGSVLVSWTIPIGGASGYVVMFYPTDDTEAITSVRIDDAIATSYTIENVETETEYTVQMLAYIHLSSDLSETTTVYLDVPGRPNNVMAMSISSSSMTVQWAGPQNTANVNGYVIRYEPSLSVMCDSVSEGEVMVTDGEVREWEVTGLEEGVEYVVRVAAFNSVGTGQFSKSNAIVSTLEEAPSGPPLNVTVIPLPPSTLIVSWQPPDCLTWNSLLLTTYTITYHTITPSQDGGREERQEVIGDYLQYELIDLTSFTDYNVSVNANNDIGNGPGSPTITASLITAPGPLESVNYQPDILSILFTWDPPERGRGYITMVTLEYYNGSGVELGVVNIDGVETKYRLGNLQPLSTYNVTLTPHTSNPTPGPTHHLTVSTIKIGSVMSVEVTVFNSTTVRISWTPLTSIHITSYIVSYSQLANGDVSEKFVMFPVNGDGDGDESGEGWGLVGGLEEGREYVFTVAAVIMIEGAASLQGDMSQPATILLEEESDEGERGFGPVIIISSAAGALLLVLVVIAIIIIIIITCLTRCYRRSGKMEVASTIELRPYRKAESLPTFDPPPINLANCRPEIIDAPNDIIAVEGEMVDFRLKVLGTPEPSVLWYHNGCMVGPDYATEIGNDGGLTLVAVEQNHEGTYRYTVSNSVGSIQGKVTLYVTSEMSGWGQHRRSGIDLPTITTQLVTVEQFPEYMREKSENGSRGLRDQFLCLSSCEANHSVSVALLDENKRYNRFTNIVPYDDNRVKLKPLGGREDCQHDYINASYIDGYGIAKKFVATQGPTDATVVDFWRMAWQLHSPTIVMMTNIHEGRKKCEQYWPQFGTADYGPYSVTLAEQKIQADYTIRKLTLTSTFSTRRVHYITHYQFTSWQDHRVPEYASPLLEFYHKLNQNHRPNKGSIIIHCSAGVGRTGAFILLDTALGQAVGERRMDIPDILTRLRNQRMKLVQTPEQYMFVHEAVLESLTCRNTRIESSQLDTTLAEISVYNSQLGHCPLDEEFAVLGSMTPHPDDSVCRVAMKYPQKNRSHDYLPTDQWRVVLKNERPDYINACFGCDYRQKEAFIISQAPLEDTGRDFWKMVYERECGVIVMLSGLVEGGRVMCQRYWPTNDVALYGEYAVTPLEEQRYEGYLERIFSVIDSRGGQAHYVSQFQVLGWSSDGKASSPVEIVNCMLNVENARRRCGDTPVIVHCSDGVTRSGMFCVAMAVIEQCLSEDVIDMFKAVRALRQQRPGAVPHIQHYLLLHKILLIFIKNNYSGSFC